MKSLRITGNLNLDFASCARLVDMANKFNSRLDIKIDNKVINIKSIMGVISIAYLESDYLEIYAQGIDEAEAIKELRDFIMTLNLVSTTTI